MSPTSSLAFSLSVPLPPSVTRASAIALLHDHEAHLGLDPHLLSYKKLGSQIVSGDAVELQTLKGVNVWMKQAVLEVVHHLTQQPREEDKEWEVEFWNVEIAHPLGRFMGNLR